MLPMGSQSDRAAFYFDLFYGSFAEPFGQFVDPITNNTQITNQQSFKQIPLRGAKLPTITTEARAWFGLRPNKGWGREATAAYTIKPLMSGLSATRAIKTSNNCHGCLRVALEEHRAVRLWPPVWCAMPST